MKKVFSRAITALTIYAAAHGCPTCVGRLSPNSPAFFAQDYTNSQAPEAGASSSQGSTAFLFYQQRKGAANVPLEFETDAPEATNIISSTPQQPLPAKKTDN